MSLKEPKPPQVLAATQDVAEAHGAGHRQLPVETEAQVRPAGSHVGPEISSLLYFPSPWAR